MIRPFLVLLVLLGIQLPATAVAGAPTLLVLGDSLSAAYGIPVERGWVALLEQRIAERGLPHQVVNASVSGETTAGGLTRLPALLKRHAPALTLIELGANDGLRGLDLTVMGENVAALVRAAVDSGSRVLLVGVRLPPNYGAAYATRFQAVLRETAEAASVPLVPAMLLGVGEDLNLMQEDGLHPTAEAQPRILDNLWPTLEPLLQATRGGR